MKLTGIPFIRITVSLRTIFKAKEPHVILAILELEQACPNHGHVLLLLLSYGSSHLQT